MYLGWRTLNNQRKPLLFTSNALKPQEARLGDWSTNGSNSPYVIASTQVVLLYRNLEDKTELWQWSPKQALPQLWFSVAGYASGLEYSERRKKCSFRWTSQKVTHRLPILTRAINHYESYKRGHPLGIRIYVRTMSG